MDYTANPDDIVWSTSGAKTITAPAGVTLLVDGMLHSGPCQIEVPDGTMVFINFISDSKEETWRDRAIRDPML